MPRRDPTNDHICLQCGKEFHRSRGHSRKPKFCSRACKNAYERESVPWWTCEQCGKEFQRDYQWNSKCREWVEPRFCSDACYRVWQRKNGPNLGVFEPGHEPWNKGLKGLHLSPATEFGKGHKPQTYQPVGTVSIKPQACRSKKLQAWVKIADPNVWKTRALINWELAHGPLPKGLILYHADGDSLNDDIGNLEALTRAELLARTRASVPKGAKSAAMKRAWESRRASAASAQTAAAPEEEATEAEVDLMVPRPRLERRIFCRKCMEIRPAREFLWGNMHAAAYCAAAPAPAACNAGANQQPEVQTNA